MKKLYSFNSGIIIFLQVIASLLLPFYVTSQSVTSLTLVNADTQQDIGTLNNGQLLILSALPSINLNVRANTNPETAGSVLFSYDSVSNFRTENIPPYSFAGDKSGNYIAWTPAPGNHTIIATPYSDSNATGIKGTSLKINFKVVKDSSGLIPGGNAEISGELKKWHRVTITFNGPASSETATPNPALDYRLDVTFTDSAGRSFKVPGYFAADGNAGETGATSGNKWRVHFSPDLTGTWTYTASFRQGTNVAVSDAATDGVAISSIDGLTGTFDIAANDKTGIDLRARGRLKPVGTSLLQWAETGEYLRKTGTDAPENFLAYDDIDNTSNYNNYRKSWSPHVQDWKPGDPAWHNGTLGKGIIGAINYLSSVGENSFSFLTFNIRGDDRNVWPYIDTAQRTRMDCSKLDQWEIIFEHSQKMGMHLHFKTQEVEGCHILDGGDVGIERKLYMRTLIAHFSHHLALNWNLGEENTQSTLQQQQMAQYYHDHDPYGSNIVVHSYPNEQELRYRPLLGNASQLTGVSIQKDASLVYSETRKWVEASDSIGKPWIVANDEQGPAADGVAADAEYTGNRGTVADNSDMIRQNVLWGNFMAGGAGVEYYYGYKTGETDLTLQDFRSRAKSYGYAKIARVFFDTYFPTSVLKPIDNVSAGWCIKKADNSAYVVYLKTGGSANITVPAGNYTVQWYNPRTGGYLQNGSVTAISAGTASIGYPPSDSSADWTALIQKIKPSNNPPTVIVTGPSNNATFHSPAKIIIKANASDSDGSITKVEFYIDNKKVGEDTTSPYSYTWSKVGPGSYLITAKAFDNAGDSTISSAVNITVDKSTPAADSIIFAVNAGGSEYTAANGITYHADTNFIGGNIYQTVSTISNTSDDSLYQSERYGNFSYAIPVSNGKYEITLRFAEIYHTAAGKRIFDVLAEDSEIISKLDIYAIAGSNNAYDIVKTITVTDNTLNIQFRSNTDFAKLSALHVKSLNSLATPVTAARPGLTTNEETTYDISVYPNPTSGLVNILHKQLQAAVIKIFDNKGVIVYKNNYAKKREQVDLSAFSPGIYYIELLRDGKKTIRKVVLIK